MNKWINTNYEMNLIRMENVTEAIIMYKDKKMYIEKYSLKPEQYLPEE